MAAKLSKKELNHLFDLIEQIGTEPQRGFIGISRHKWELKGSFKVAIPTDLADFPWAGRVVEVFTSSGRSLAPVHFQIHEETIEFKAYELAPIRWLAVPVIKVRHKQKPQNVFSYDRFLQLSPALRDELTKLHPNDPKTLLAQILSVDGTHWSSEPFDQMRCGLAAAWIQSPRFHKCSVCRRPLRLILQVPGALLGSQIAEGCFYLFGCPSHADNTITDEDWG